MPLQENRSHIPIESLTRGQNRSASRYIFFEFNTVYRTNIYWFKHIHVLMELFVTS